MTRTTYRLTSAAEVARLTALASVDGGDAPGSRYGTYVRDYAPWAVAASIVLWEFNGIDGEESDTIDGMLSDVVNDRPGPAEFVAEGWDKLPRGLRQTLGGRRYARQLSSD